MLSLLNDTLSSYTAALAKTMHYSDVPHEEGFPANFELLKRYRLYTRYLCELARELWPKVKLGWLYQQA